MSEGPKKQAAREPRRWIGDLISIAVVFSLLLAVYLLPPDTSLREIRDAGILRACVPPEYPPLVTGDPEMPGFEIELLQAMADDLGVRLVLGTNPAIGRDFNPRSWRVTRANCQIIAGGVMATPTTRSFLETTPPHLETGWALVAPDASPASLEGRDLAFLAGISGGDRVALSGFLRDRGANARAVSSVSDFVRGIESGEFDAGVVEALLGSQIAEENGWTVTWLSQNLGRAPLAFGLWKGDLTLKRELVSSLATLQENGFVAQLMERYDIDPIAESPYDQAVE